MTPDNFSMRTVPTRRSGRERTPRKIRALEESHPVMAGRSALRMAMTTDRIRRELAALGKEGRR